MFGDYIDVYDLTRAVEDGATVKIFYESRLARVGLDDADLATLDEFADEITEQVEQDAAVRAKSRWARLEAIVDESWASGCPQSGPARLACPSRSIAAVVGK